MLVLTRFTEGSRRTLKCQQFLCTCTKLVLLKTFSKLTPSSINPLNAELNPICYLPALLGAHHILHISRIRVNDATNINSQQCFTKVRSVSRNSPAEDIKKLRHLVVSWMFCKYLQQFHEFREFHNGRHYSS